MIYERQPSYSLTIEKDSPFVDYVISAKSSDVEAHIRRIDDIISVRQTDDPNFPTEVMIGFANPGVGLDGAGIRNVFQSDLPFDAKYKYLCEEISRVRPPQNYSLYQGKVRPGIAVIQRLNIESGQTQPPYLSLSPLVNKKPVTIRQLNTFVWSELDDRDTRNYQEAHRAALFYRAKRLNPYSAVRYDRTSETILVNESAWDSAEEATSPANDIVQELTLNASAALAIFAYWNRVPVIYKGTNDSIREYQPIYDTQPVIHRYYNLNAYLNVSRQLRSFIDKVNGFQLSHYIANQTLEQIPLQVSHLNELLNLMADR